MHGESLSNTEMPSAGSFEDCQLPIHEVEARVVTSEGPCNVRPDGMRQSLNVYDVMADQHGVSPVSL